MTPTEREPYIEIRNERLQRIAASQIYERFNQNNGYTAAGTSKFQRAVADAFHDALYELVDRILTEAEKGNEFERMIGEFALEEVDRQFKRDVGMAQDEIDAERGE